jgi:hypothetical protein
MTSPVSSRSVRVCVGALLFTGALLSLVTNASGQTSTTQAGPALPPNASLDAPVIHCSWPLVGNEIPATPTTPEIFAYQSDDDVVTPRGAAGAPCKVDGNGVVRQRANATGMVQLINNEVTGRNLRLWAAVSDPVGDSFGLGTATLNWTVQRPDGTLFDPIPYSLRSCEGTTGPGALWRASSVPVLNVSVLGEPGAATFGDPGSGLGVGTGAFGPKTVSNPEGSGLWQRCRQGQIRIFSGKWRLPMDAECGQYTVITRAAKGELFTEQRYSFEVLCPANATLDTANIHWTIAPGESAEQRGDFDPQTTDMATVTNLSKSPMQLGVVFSPLTQVGADTTISEFGVAVIHVDGTLTGTPKFSADTDNWVDGEASIVCPGESVRLDVRAFAPNTLLPGEYSGSIRLLSRTGGRC